MITDLAQADATLIIAGHSHCTALGVPLKPDPPEAEPLVELERGAGKIFGLTGVWPRDEAFWEELARVAKGNVVALFWRGNQHVSTFMFAPEVPFDFVFAGAPGLPVEPGVTLLPELGLHDLLSVDFPGLSRVVEAIQANGGRAVLCGTPAPKDDDEFLRAMLTSERSFVESARQLGYDILSAPLTAKYLRWKLWAVVQEVYRNFAQQHHIPFQPTPAQSLTAEGFLKQEYWANDVSHANRAYGKLFLDELAARFLAVATN